VRDLNGIVASIMFGNKTAYGDAFEYPLAALASLLENGADATTDELLDAFAKNLQGGVRSKSYLNISHVSKKDRKFLNIKNSIPINNGAILEYSNPTILSFDYYPSLSFEENSRKIDTTNIPTGVSN
jgi:hypothetical protein